MPVGVNTKPAGAGIDALKLKLDDLTKRVAEVKIGANDKVAQLALARMNVALDRLNVRVARPGVTLEGQKRAMADILALDLALDNLNKKHASPSVLSRIRGIIPGVPGGAGANGPGGLLGALPAAQGLLNPYTIGAGILATPLLAQVLSGGIVSAFGGGLAGLGIAGALGTGKTVSPAMLTAAQDQLHAAQLKVIADQDKLNQLQASGKTTAGQLAAAQSALASAQGSVITSQAKLNQLSNDAQTPAQIQMRKAFANLSNDAQNSLAQIGTSFVPVMQSVFNTADSVLMKMTPVFAGAVKQISGPFKTFADTLISTFSQPAVVQSINAVAKAFGAILTALAPSLPSIMQTIADGVTRIARAVSENPKAFADFITWLFKLAGYALDAIAALAQVANYLEKHWVPGFDRARHNIALWWDEMVSALIRSWDGFWTDTIGRTIQGGHDIEAAFNDTKAWLWKNFVAPLETFFLTTLPDAVKTSLNTISGVWHAVWDDLKLAFLIFIRDGVLTPLGWIIDAAAKAFGWVPVLGGKLKDAAKQFDQFRDQVNAAIAGINDKTVNVNVNMGIPGVTQGIPVGVRKAAGGFISGGTPGMDSVAALLMPGEVVVPTAMVRAGAVDHLRGRLPGFAAGGAVPGVSVAPATPSATDIDSAVNTAVIKLAQAFAASAATVFAGSAAGPGGGAPAANAALARSMFPAWGSGAEWAAWNSVAMAESGWNQFADNPSSGAYGIPQALPFTKMPRAAWPPWAGGSANPRAQIGWMISYIQSVYGDPIRAWAHEAAFRWYGRGGLVGMAGGGAAPSFFASTAALRHALATAQAGERAKYFGLGHSFAIGPRKYYTPAVHHDLGVLAARQAAELAAYGRLGGAGLTPVHLAALAAAARAESAVAARQPLSRSGPGGHPLWNKALRGYLGALASIGGLAPPGTQGTGPGGLPVLGPVAHIYGGDVVANTIGRALAEAVNPFGAARGGMVPARSYDRGGYLSPGWNLAYNGTGAPEPVGGGDIHVHFHNHGVIGSAQELDTWLTTSIRKTVKTRGGGSVQRAYGAH